MSKHFLLIAALWLLLFIFRINQIGGIDPAYRDQEISILQPLRENLVEVINKITPYPQSALLSGILLGSQENLPYSLKTDLKNTATIHMVVVSGQNLTILTGFLIGLIPFIGRKKVLVISLGAILLYSVLTGLQVPVIRAAIMITLTYLAQILGKERSGWWVLLITAGGMLLFNPNWLLSISFQLSFLATFGVIVVSPILEKYIKLVPNIFKQDLSVTLAAQVLTMPVIAYNFGQISVVGIISNLFTLWTIPIIMVSGFISLTLGTINHLLGQISGLIPGILLTYFINIVQIFAKLPGSGMKVGESSLILWVGYYLITGAIILGLYQHKKINHVHILKKYGH